MFSFSSICRYIHRELVVKNALPSLSLPSFLEDWVDDNSNICVYTPMQLTKFPCVHLVAGGWYFDCFRAFVSDVKKSLYNNLVSSVLEVIKLEEEPEEDEKPAPLTNDKEVAPVKGKGKCKKVAFSQMSTCFFTKACVQRTPVLATTVVGSPTATPSVHSRDHALGLSYSGVTIPSVPRKSKAIALDTSATSSEKSSSLSLLKNVDMGDFIEDLMRSKVPLWLSAASKRSLVRFVRHSLVFPFIPYN